MDAPVKNPFSLRVGQIMTGFGAGCGIGLGVGYPIALGSIPVLGDALSATSNASSRAFGGVSHRAFGMLKKLGIKNLAAGAGCGIGIGHGFGVGVALKPGVSRQIAHSVQEKLSAVGSKLQKYLPGTDKDSPENKIEPSSLEGSDGVEVPLGNKLADKASGEPKFFVQSDITPSAKNESVTSTWSGSNGETEDLRRENEILRTLLRHQELIEDLTMENAELWQVLSQQFGAYITVGDEHQGKKLKTKRSTKFRRKNAAVGSMSDCFDCRRAARRIK